MSGYTPGPWVFDPGNTGMNFSVGYGITTEHRGWTVVHVPMGPDDGVGEANARLIAAAPELLEAARALTARFGHSPGPFDDAIWGGTVENLRAAIAKAEGR